MKRAFEIVFLLKYWWQHLRVYLAFYLSTETCEAVMVLFHLEFENEANYELREILASDWLNQSFPDSKEESSSDTADHCELPWNKNDSFLSIFIHKPLKISRKASVNR